MNIFQDTYQNRSRDWRQLRNRASSLDTATACVEIDRWWQQAPLINNHLHWNDTENWSDPWTLLSENTYCVLTRAIGMCYTLLMSGFTDIQLVVASDQQCEEHYLVLVDSAKYTLNYWPDSVLSTSPTEFTINRVLSLDPILNKIK